jgi:serine/threonine protein kinase
VGNKGALVGQTIGGRFVVERLLGRGGMGSVYEAKDARDPAAQRVALKVLREDMIGDAVSVSRFLRESRIATELTHDSIVRTRAAGNTEGVLWLAMDYVDGDTLRARLDTRGRLPWAATLPWMHQLGSALATAHAKGVIHRDVKPENVMVTRTGRAMLVDFGLARSTAGNVTRATGSGLVVGTVGYLAPEVILDGHEDERADLYALGCVWFELLTGQRPFNAKTAIALSHKHAFEPPPKPSDVARWAEIPPAVDELVLQLLAKKPEERPRDAKDFVGRLETLENPPTQPDSGPVANSDGRIVRIAGPDVFDDGLGLRGAFVAPFFVASFYGPGTPDRIRYLADNERRFLQRSKPIAIMAIRDPRVGNKPTREHRDLSVQLFREFDPTTVALCFVIRGAGFWAATARGLIAGVGFASRAKWTSAVDVDEGAKWLLEKTRAGGVDANEIDLKRAIAEVVDRLPSDGATKI